MKQTILEPNLRSILFQRNIFLSLSFLLAIFGIIISSFLFIKKERVVICPPVIQKEFWIDSNNISPAYLEQMGVFLGQLLLNKSIKSAPEQRTVILRHVAPNFFQAMRKKLIDEEEALKKQNIAYTFYLGNVQVNTSLMEVYLSGDHVAYTGSKQISSHRENYVLKFIFDGSKLLLTEVKVGEPC